MSHRKISPTSDLTVRITFVILPTVDDDRHFRKYHGQAQSRLRRSDMIRLGIAAVSALALVACATSPQPSNGELDMANYKQQVVELLKSIETGDSKPIAYINPNKYVQHNLAVGDGLADVRALFQALPKGSARANTVRVFQDGNFVFAHTDYNFFGPKVGFDIFRFEDGKIVEHWDNLEAKCQRPNASGRTQIDGPTEIKDLDKTEANKVLLKEYFEVVVIGGHRDRASRFRDKFHQHNCFGE